MSVVSSVVLGWSRVKSYMYLDKAESTINLVEEKALKEIIRQGEAASMVQ